MIQLPFPRRNRVRLSLIVIAFVSLCEPCQSQEKVEHRFSDFAEFIPAAHTQILAINDPATHLENLLQNRALNRILNESAIGEMTAGINLLPERGLAWLETYRVYFPRTVAISTNEKAWQSLANLMDVFLRMQIAANSLTIDELDEDDMTRLEKELSELVKETRVPEIVLWIDWQDEPTASQLYSMLKFQLQSIIASTSLQFDSDRDSFQISGELEDVLAPEYVDAYLTEIGLVDFGDEIKNSTLKMELFLKCETKPHGMRISIGTDPVDQPGTQIEHLVGLENGSNQIAWGTWVGTGVTASAIKQLENSIANWSDTKLGAHSIEQDVDDFWGSLRQFINELRRLSSSGQARAWTETNQVHAMIRMGGKPANPSLEDAPILKLIPSDAESYALSSNRSMAQFAFDWLENAEERMATQSLKSLFTGDLERSDLFDLMSEQYYEHFGPLRTLLRDEMPKTPALAFGVVMDTQGNVSALEITHDTLEIPVDLSVKNFTRFAAISQSSEPTKLVDQILELYDHFVSGIFGVCDKKRPADLETTGEIEINSSTTATVFTLDWLQNLNSLTIKIEGDFQPHVFVHDGIVIFSTSVDLSRLLVSADETLKIPASETGAAIVNQGRFRGKTIGNSYAALFKILFGFLSAKMGFNETPIFGEFIDTGAKISEVMNHCDWQTTQADNVMQTNYLLDFQDK